MKFSTPIIAIRKKTPVHRLINSSVKFLLACMLMIVGQYSQGQVSMTAGGTYTQNFNTLPASGSAVWTNNTTIPGWYHARTGTGATIVADDGTNAAGNLYSYGTGTGTDRALGSVGSTNATAGSFFWGVRLVNNTGSTITFLNVSYTGEQWRNSAAAAQTVAFSYLVGSPSVTGSLAEFQSAGVAVASLNFTSPVTGGVAGALDGNLAANRTAISFNITGLNIPNGTEVMLRWADPDHTGNDHGLSIDDVTISWTAGPIIANLGDHLPGNATTGNTGDVITYQDTIKNSGNADALGVNLNDPTPVGTSLNAGSLKTSALARDDNFSFNTTPSNGNVLTNDFGLPSLSVVSFGTTANAAAHPSGTPGLSDNGGSVTVNSNGTFTYSPASAFTGTDRFSYIATTGVAGLPNNDAVVTITVTSDLAFTTTNVDPACNGNSNGSITVNATGGNSGYTYSKDNGANFQGSNIFSGLAAGAYNIVVMDAGGYTKSGTATLNNPAAIVVSGTIPNLTYNTAMATATFSKTGGTGTPATPWSATGLPTGISINSANGNVTGTPTQTGSFTPTITYTDANGCTGSVNAPFTVAPKLANDAYNVVGNTQLVADGQSSPTTPFTASAINIKTNDGADAAITITAVTDAATTGGGSITIDANGKFTYTPPVGSVSPDSYVYTGTANGISSTATINFTIAGKVWYVNNTYANANGASDGRSHRPFTTVDAAEAVALRLMGGNQVLSVSGDIIYVHTGSGNTTGNAVLKTGQTLRGAGSALNVGALSIAAGTKPTLSGTITLANNVTVDGFDMSTGAATAFTNAGNTVTGVVVNVGDVTTTTGTGITLTGTGNNVTITLASLTTVHAPASVSLTNTAGTVTINGGSILSDGTAFLINGGTASVTYSGSITQNNAGRVIDIQNKTAGTVTFSGTTNTAGGSTGPFLNNNTGATINFTNTLNLSTNVNPAFTATGGGTVSATGGGNIFTTSATSLNLANVTVGAGGMTFSSVNANNAVNAINLNTVTGTGSITINGGTITGAAGAPINIVGGTVSLTYSGGASQANVAQPLVNVSGGHATGTITFNTGTLSATNGTGLQFDNADGTYNFNGTTTLNGGDAGIDILNGSTGTFNFGTGVAITNPTGTSFNLSGATASNANVTYSGSISDNSGFAVDIDNHDAGTITFQTGNITSTASGIRVQNCGGGTINFNNPSKSLNTGANTAVTLSTNTGSTINFGTSGLVISTTTATGFNATGGGTVNVTGTGNTITSTTGTALNVTSTTIGASNLNFQSISANGAANGIVLNNTGSSGGLIVTGDGGATNNGSGGTIATPTAEGVLLTNTSNVNLGYMNITNPGTNGIRGTGVNGFTLNRCNISDNAGNVTVDDGVGLSNTSGAVSITNCVITTARHQGITIDNFNTNMASLTISSSSVTGTVGGDGVLIQMRGTSVMTTGTIGGATAALGNTFSTNSSTGLQVSNSDNGNILSLNVQNNTCNGNNAGMDFDLGQSSSMTVTAQNNTITNSHTTAMNTVASTSSTGGTLTVTFRNNNIGIAGVLDSGSGIGTGIRVANGGTNVFLTIDGNIIREVPNGRGIDIEPQAYIPNLTVKVKIVNNQIIKPTGTNQDIGCGFHVPCPSASVFILSDNNGGGFDHVCSSVTGNTAYDPTSWAAGGEAAYYFARRTTASNTLNLEGNTGLTPRQNVLANNTVTNFTAADFIDEATSGPVTVVAVGTCGSFPARIAFGPSVDSDKALRIEQQRTPGIFLLKNVIPIKRNEQTGVITIQNK